VAHPKGRPTGDVFPEVKRPKRKTDLASIDVKNTRIFISHVQYTSLWRRDYTREPLLCLPALDHPVGLVLRRSVLVLGKYAEQILR
jgi:hypothetical protein